MVIQAGQVRAKYGYQLLDMKYHKVVSKIVGLLEGGGYWFETFEHQPVRTSEEAGKVRTGYSLAQGAKAMIVRIKKSASDKSFAMLVLPGDRRFDFTKVKQLFDAKDIRFATEDEVIKLTDGVFPGGCRLSETYLISLSSPIPYSLKMRKLCLTPGTEVSRWR